MEKYNPERIQHVPGQEGSKEKPLTAGNIEKAHIMAEVEQDVRSVAEMYEEFLSKPETFLSEYPLVDGAVERYMKLLGEQESETDAQPEEEDREMIFSAGFGGKTEEKTSASKMLFREHMLDILEGDLAVKEYMEDEEAYLEDHPTDSKMLAELADFQARGVAPEYIRKIGEVQAEVQGAVVDYYETLEQKKWEI